MYDVCMITTAEHLIDPVAYVTENILPTQIFQDDLAKDGFSIVSGADYDVLVQQDRYETIGRKDYVLRGPLGNLYVGGDAKGVVVGDESFDMDWFPSSAYANNLAAQLGLVAGRDVLHFVQAESDAIPQARYRAHLANREFPQSMGPKYFSHDRHSGHAVPALLLPPHFMNSVVLRAKQTTDKIVEKRAKSFMSNSIIDMFDMGTESIGELFRGVSSQNPQSTGRLNGSGRGLYESLWLFGHKNGKKGMQAALDQIAQHYVSLLPKIEALQAMTPALIDRAGVYRPASQPSLI